MLILRSVGVLALVALTWWSMADIARSSGFIQFHVAGAFDEPPPVRPEPGSGLDLVEDGDMGRGCCVDLDRARGTALFATLFGAIPMAAVVVLIRRRSRGALSATVEPFLLAGFIFQFAALVIASLLILVFAPFMFEEPGREGLPIFAYLVVTAVVSALALPLWHDLRRRVTVSGMPTLKSARVRQPPATQL